MTTSAIVGLGFGDEGKGVVTEYLCSQSPADTVVVRFCGGSQCSHKVMKGDKEHIFASFGSGTLSGCATYWSQHCTFDPYSFVKEYGVLQDKGVQPRITIHPHCPVTTMYDVFVNRQAEVTHGTTGTGFFETKQRHFKRGVPFTVEDLLGPWIGVAEKLDAIQSYYNVAERLDIGPFVEACFELRKLVKYERVGISERIPPHSDLVFEGGQGLMLDEHIGYMPHCTPSDVTPKNALRMVDKIDEIYLVTRAYQTRHGNGPLTNEGDPLELINTESEHNVFNQYQGEFRKSILDLDQLMHAKKKGIDEIVPASTKVNLVMTCTDQLEEYKVSVGNEIGPFSSIDKFIRFIGSSLKINGDLYINTSPYATTIKKVPFRRS